MSAGATAALSPVTVIVGRKLESREGIDDSRRLDDFFCRFRLCAQRVTGRPLRDSERAIAVPQAPEPSTTIWCDGQDGHAVLAAPKRFSVPASRRRMLGWCLTMMSSATMICTAMKNAGRVAADQEPGKDGKAGRAEDGGERDVAGDGEHDGEQRDGGQRRPGAATRKTPKPVATPLPPRNLSHTGNMWPRTAKRAARASTLRCGTMGSTGAGDRQRPAARRWRLSARRAGRWRRPGPCRRNAARWWRRCCRCRRCGCPGGGRSAPADSRQGSTRAGKLLLQSR